MKKIVIFNPSDYRILFLLAATIKTGYRPTYGYRLEPLWGAEEIILLNINPKEEEAVKLNAHPDLDVFIGLKLANIKAWLNFPGKLDLNNPIIQNILKYFNPQMESDSLDLNNPNKWLEKPHLAKYGKALRTAKIISINKGDMTEYRKLLIDTANSLAKGQNNIGIDTFQIQYERVIEITEYCFARISKNQNLIKLPGQEIAFAYLDNVSNYLDLSALRAKCLSSYPYLTIIQYRQHGRQYNWFLSKKQLNIKKVFQLPDSKNDYELLIEYPHNKMLLHLQKSIEGISKT